MHHLAFCEWFVGCYSEARGLFRPWGELLLKRQKQAKPPVPTKPPGCAGSPAMLRAGRTRRARCAQTQQRVFFRHLLHFSAPPRAGGRVLEQSIKVSQCRLRAEKPTPPSAPSAAAFLRTARGGIDRSGLLFATAPPSSRYCSRTTSLPQARSSRRTMK